MNVTKILGQLLIDAVDEHIAPNTVEELAFERMLAAGISEELAHELSDCMFELAQFVKPE